MQGRGGKFLVLCAQCRQPSSSRFPRMICQRYVMELSWYVIATDMSQVMPCRLRCWSGCMLTEASFFAWQHRGAFGYTRGRCSQSIQKQPFILISLHLFTYIVYIYMFAHGCLYMFVSICLVYSTYNVLLVHESQLHTRGMTFIGKHVWIRSCFKCCKCSCGDSSKIDKKCRPTKRPPGTWL